MTRYLFPGDTVFEQDGDAVEIGDAVVITFWNQAEGGTQHTDVTALDGVTAANLTADSNGNVGPCLGPDEVRVMWRDTGNTIRYPVYASDEVEYVLDGFRDLEATVAGIPGGGSSDHGTLAGLADDDHAQYHNDARGDARYYLKAEVVNLTNAAATAQSAADRNRANHSGTDPNNSIPIAAVTALESRLAALEAGGGGGGTNPFGGLFRTLDSFAGASTSAKFRQALIDVASLSPKPIVIIPPNTTLDSGANNPFEIPTGFHMMGVPGPEDETGHNCTVNLRHTGSTTTPGVFEFAPNSRDQKFTGIAFKGTSTTRAFRDVAGDGSSGDFPQYITLFNVSFNQFESVYTGTGTGIKWAGIAYLNNMSATREPVYINGSDHTLWSNGCLFEMGGVGSYATRSALNSMVRFGTCSNTSVGPIYWTGSPTTPVRIDGGNTGIDFSQAVLEGRPSSGTVGGDTPTDGLHCNGALLRMSGGRATFRNREWGYAMRDPRSTINGYQPGGFIHQSGGDLVVDGGTFAPYVNTVYPAWTRPDGVAYPVDTIPPIAWVTGATTRLNITNITRGPNASANPVVYADNGATVIHDASVTLITV